ncbi:hypothetical protein H310_11655 [Aphanomyces invadans]|uniref:Uncharacterized protein n=1 Tax=Aphanomyces invadans TaxID=157072 RepID=A0A024TKY7_9STRA|nr:hypothetical protein H310_11655 [Aphanomyces invadans]ETV94669.1 hypothetical protein H310_11655 [Aphanomyces invadans]|eukprot:XP_008876614.1 hypothetical protein H310_11655 [Aphanomyces invadans]
MTGDRHAMTTRFAARSHLSKQNDALSVVQPSKAVQGALRVKSIGPVSSNNVNSNRPRKTFQKKRGLTIPRSPNFSKPRLSTVRKLFQPPVPSPKPLPAPYKKRMPTKPVSPKLSKPRNSVVKPALPIREKVQPKRSNSYTPKKRPLTQPLTPNFAKRPARRTSVRVSATTKELLEIEAKRQEVMLERRKNQQYHQATQGFRNVGGGKTQFRMTLRSAGVIGVPAIRRPKLTEFKEFNFLVDKRAQEKKAKEELKRKAQFSPLSTSGRPTQRRKTQS